MATGGEGRTTKRRKSILKGKCKKRKDPPPRLRFVEEEINLPKEPDPPPKKPEPKVLGPVIVLSVRT